MAANYLAISLSVSVSPFHLFWLTGPSHPQHLSTSKVISNFSASCPYLFRRQKLVLEKLALHPSPAISRDPERVPPKLSKSSHHFSGCGPTHYSQTLEGKSVTVLVLVSIKLEMPTWHGLPYHFLSAKFLLSWKSRKCPTPYSVSSRISPLYSRVTCENNFLQLLFGDLAGRPFFMNLSYFCNSYEQIH